MTEANVDCFESPAPPTICQEESRRHQRMLFCQQAWIVPLHLPSQHHSIMIRDISTIGVGFVAAHAFTPGSWLLMTVQFPNGAVRKILAFTRRCEPLNNGLFHTGAEFEAAIALDSPSNDVPDAWLEWVLDQQDPMGGPQGRPVLEPELIASCGATASQY